MLGMNGIDLAREVRRLHPGLPVVPTSGNSHVLAQDGTCGFESLHKPCSVEQLNRVLGWVLTRRSLSPGMACGYQPNPGPPSCMSHRWRRPIRLLESFDYETRDRFSCLDPHTRGLFGVLA